MQTKNKNCTSLNYSTWYKQTQKPHPNRKTFNHINGNLYHYAGNNPVKYTDPDGREDDEPIVMKAYNETNSAKIEESVKASLFPNSNCEEKTINQNKEQKLLWSEASFVEGAGENSCYLQAGLYSLSSELNDSSKNNHIYAQGQLNILTVDFSANSADKGCGAGFSLNGASLSGKIGYQSDKMLFSVGMSAGITAGGEVKVDLEKKMFIFDISCILGVRIEACFKRDEK